MNKTFKLDNIRCEGCANTIKKTLSKKGFTDIFVDLSTEPRKVTVEIISDESEAQFREILRKLGYPFSNENISLGSSTVMKAKSFVSCAIGKLSDDTDNK